MIGNNVKLLTKEQYEFLNNKYIFTLKDGKIEVSFKDYERKTIHDCNKAFSIYNIDLKKIFKFTKDAIDIWKQLQLDDKFKKYTLIDVQEAVKILLLSYQEQNIDNVKKILSKRNIKIKHI